MISVSQVVSRIRSAVDEYRQGFLEGIRNTTLDKLISKNSYLYSNRIVTARDFLSQAFDAFLSSSEETMFGTMVMEKIAIAVVGATKKSGTTGMDIDLPIGDYRLLISMKSGKSWGNAQSTGMQGVELKKAARTIGDISDSKVKRVMGIAYGKTRTSTKISHADLKFTGQTYWYVLSRNPNFYIELTDEIVRGAADFASSIVAEKAKVLQSLIPQFIQEYCDPGTENILWGKLVRKTCTNLNPNDCHARRIMASVAEAGKTVVMFEGLTSVRIVGTHDGFIEVQMPDGTHRKCLPWELEL